MTIARQEVCLVIKLGMADPVPPTISLFEGQKAPILRPKGGLNTALHVYEPQNQNKSRRPSSYAMDRVEMTRILRKGQKG